MNRTLLETTRAMLKATGLGKSFWVEAVNTACYMINRSPSTAIELKTSIEMWTGKPVDYSQLHIDTTKRLMFYPKYTSVEVINNPARPGSNHREINYKLQIIIIIIIS